MTEKFNNIGKTRINDLPEAVQQMISDRCALILMAALTDDGKQTVPANIALGGMQKACALLIAKFFEQKDILRATEALVTAIIDNVQGWKDK